LSRYTAITEDDLQAMLAAIGVSSVQEMFERQIPEAVRLGRELELPQGKTEQEVYAHLAELAARNTSAED
jgi:glycine cleavage system pyridoxal-binding protein P